MKPHSLKLTGSISILAITACVSAPETIPEKPAAANSAASQLPVIGEVDPRYQAFNIDLIAITGRAQKEAASSEVASNQTLEKERVETVMSGITLEDPLDLSNSRLRILARGLGPAFLRTSGTSANEAFFQDSHRPAPDTLPEGYESVLTRAQWKGVIDFAEAVDAKLLMSFTINSKVRDENGIWTPLLAKPLVDYTHSIGGTIDAAELFNEPNLPAYGGAPKGYDAAWFAKDQAAFRAFAEEALPDMKIVGPGDVITANYPLPGNQTGASLMTGNPTPRFDVISYHFYPAVSPRCAPPGTPVSTSPELSMTDGWFERTEKSLIDHKALRDRYAPGAPIWNTETAGAACSGAPWSATFLDSFRYVDQLGRLAKLGANMVFNQTLVGGNYGMLEPETFEPRPNYWAALLWKRLVGTTVLDSGISGTPRLHVYAHCSVGGEGAVTYIAVNAGETAQSLPTGDVAQVYTLTSPELQSKSVLLNGQILQLGKNDALPKLTSREDISGEVQLPATSISFVKVPGAGNPSCQ